MTNDEPTKSWFVEHAYPSVQTLKIITPCSTEIQHIYVNIAYMCVYIYMYIHSYAMVCNT